MGLLGLISLIISSVFLRLPSFASHRIALQNFLSLACRLAMESLRFVGDVMWKLSRFRAATVFLFII